jgi:hypothetical protein
MDPVMVNECLMISSANQHFCSVAASRVVDFNHKDTSSVLTYVSTERIA